MAELKGMRQTIEGFVASVGTSPAQQPEADTQSKAEGQPDFEDQVAGVEVNPEINKDWRGWFIGTTRMEFSVGSSGHQKTLVKFADGREIEFAGVSPKPIEVGRYYTFTYNAMGEIVEAVAADIESQE